MDNYDDIIHLPHHVSKRHPQMSMWNRAAQFAPFAALTGYEESIKESAQENELLFEETPGTTTRKKMKKSHVFAAYILMAAAMVLPGCRSTSAAGAAGAAGDGKNVSKNISRWEQHLPTVTRIEERGTLLVGTTGDYRPLSFREKDGRYWGFGIDVAKELARRLGVEVQFVPTSWPTLTADVLAEPQQFDLAIGGITITDARRETMLMSEGYLANGKTMLCRAAEAGRYQSLADIDKPGVRVMVNPGGLNEQFAHEHLTHATILVHQKNEEIPSLVAEGKADVMITEITEAPYYVQSDPRLAAPLMDKPFNHGEIGVLMRKGQEDLLQAVNAAIREMRADGTLRQLLGKYGLENQ